MTDNLCKSPTSEGQESTDETALFVSFAPPDRGPDALRSAITAATRIPEPVCVR